jgi:hypothetical protein
MGMNIFGASLLSNNPFNENDGSGEDLEAGWNALMKECEELEKESEMLNSLLDENSE